MRQRLAFSLVVVTLALAAAPSQARALEPGGGAEPETSVFLYTGRGFLVGGMLGLSIGYMVAREGGWKTSDDWPSLAYGAGIGALTGGVLGVTLGVVDMSRDTPGWGSVVLEDTVKGTGAGALGGALVGGLAAISTKKGEHVLFGAAVGTAVGAGAGMVLGVIEANHMLARRRARHGAAGRVDIAMTVTAAEAADRGVVWMPGLVGAF
jgi:hypothetical protein